MLLFLAGNIIEVHLGGSEDLLNGVEKHDVGVQLELQLFVVVLHWNHVGERNTQMDTHLLHLNTHIQYSKLKKI